jgi:ubiquinol-cytochrome c reductase cytochrome c subunit
VRGSRAARGAQVAHLAALAVLAVSVVLGITLLRPERVGAQAPGAQPAAEAPSIYLRDCAVCHGVSGAGTTRAPSLQGVGAAAIDYWISTGRMPLVDNGRDPRSPFEQTPPGQLLPDPALEPHRHQPAYPPAVVHALVSYVSSVTGAGPPIPTVDLLNADVATGGEVFRLQCAACHSWDGTGGALYQRQAPSIHLATPTQVAEAVRTGPDNMPAFGTSAVPPGQLDDLVAYVRYLDHPDDRGGASLWHLGPVAEGGVAIIGGLGALLLVTRWIGERT